MVCNGQRGLLVYAVDETGLQCTLPPLQWIALLAFFVSLVCCLCFSAMAFAYVVPIADITRQIEGSVIITSHGGHWLRGAASVSFSSTGVPWLDTIDTQQWNVKRVSKERLLLHAHGEGFIVATVGHGGLGSCAWTFGGCGAMWGLGL